MADKKVEQYCKEVGKEFIENYTKELDNNILNMMQYFGYDNDNFDNSSKWLDDNKYRLLFDEDIKSEDDRKTKAIYLEDIESNEVVALFMIQTWIEEGNLIYRFSDIFYKEKGE